MTAVAAARADRTEVTTDARVLVLATDVLPPVLDVPSAGRLLGLGRSAAYALVETGQWPTPVLRLGRRLRVPTAPLLALLGLAEPGVLSHPGGTMVGSSTAPDAPSLDGDVREH